MRVKSGIRSFSSRGLTLGAAPLMIPVVAFLFFFFIVPTVMMLSLSFLDTGSAFTLENYAKAFSSRVVVRTVLNTCEIAAWTVAFTVILAYPVAYYLATSRASYRQILLVVVLMPFWTSILVRTFAWILILSRNGVINSTLTDLGLQSEPSELLYSLFAVVVSVVHAVVPMAVLTMLSVMQNIDRNLESAAATLGAERGNAFWRIYFPLSFPGVASATLVTFIVSLGLFVQPALVGSPNEMMIAQVIIRQIDDAFNWNMAAAIAVMMLCLSVAIIFVSDKVLGIAKMNVSNSAGSRSGAVGRAITAGLGWVTVWISRFFEFLLPFRKISDRSSPGKLVTALCLIIVAFLAAPMLFLIPVSFTESKILEWPPRGFSFQWYQAYLESQIWIEATLRSLYVGVATAVLSLCIGVPAAFAISRSNFPLKGISIPYILLPLVVPNIITALALFYFFSYIGLVGTSIGLIIGHSVIALPYVVLTMVATLQNYDVRLDQAAWTLGAGKIYTFKLITLPLVKIGVVTSFLFSFVRSFDELTIAIFISHGLATTLPRRIWSEAYFNSSPTLAAVSTLLILLVTAIILVTEMLSRRGYQTSTSGRI